MWIDLYGVDAFIEDGKVIRGVFNGNTGYPYIKSRSSGWDIASGDLTVDAFRTLYERDAVAWW